jgi:molybdopterin/thiamine biosynthesis adenylyltransferase/rhodanese-related sulfurtransferase
MKLHSCRHLQEDKMLNKEEIARYSRHLLLPEIGIKGQEKLKNAKVLVIGAGGLGCPALLYLTAAGVGEIGIIDFDKVDASNLQRQIIYSVEDVGKLKTKVAAEKLRKQNPFVKLTTHELYLNNQNALDIIKNYDIVIDGTDNFSTRYLVNDASVILHKPLVYGSIYRFEGQVSVFNYKGGPTYRCIFPEPPSPESAPNCSTIGVLGVLPGIIGTMQANEAIKIITEIGEPLSGKLLLFDALKMDFTTIDIQYNKESIKNSPATTEEFLKMDYDHFCGVTKSMEEIKNITAKELASLLSEKANIQLLDVREPGELPEAPELLALQIPLGDILQQVNKISKEKKTIVFCRSGARSKHAIELLQKDLGFTNLYNLEGGIMKWIEEHQLK